MARTADEFDTTSAEQREAALSTGAATQTLLGTEVASLGDPAEPGLWLRTSLVEARTPGRVEVEGTGASALVELIPTDGGSRLSLPAMRLLELPLTELPTVKVYVR